MRLHLPTAVCTAALAMAITSCNTDTATTPENKSHESPDKISNTDFKMTIKSAIRYYDIKSTEYPCKLSLQATVDWSETIGEHNLDNLHSYIIGSVNDSVKASDIDSAILTYVDTPERFGLGDSISQVTAFNGLSESNYESAVRIRLMSVDTATVNFSIAKWSYMGGAHPMSYNTVFTYNLKQSKVIDNPWLFKPGYESTLQPVLEQRFAEKAGMTPAQLKKTMLVNKFPISENVYLQDGNIMFCYNPYEVLPYSFGEIDVAIEPYAVKDILTPQASALVGYDQ